MSFRFDNCKQLIGDIHKIREIELYYPVKYIDMYIFYYISAIINLKY